MAVTPPRDHCIMCSGNMIASSWLQGAGDVGSPPPGTYHSARHFDRALSGCDFREAGAWAELPDHTRGRLGHAGAPMGPGW